jgi:zinc transport system permease protein
MLEYAFMQRALLASVLIGAVCGVLGFFVVLRRLAFVGVGISHSAIGGVAIGILVGWHPLLCAGLFAGVVALGIAAAGERTGIGTDALIGVFFSGSMALGVLLFSLQRGTRQDLFGYLFGNVLAISNGELLALASSSALVLGVLALTFRDLLFVAFDDEAARAYGHPVATLNALLLVLVAATVVIGVRLVGVLLVQALLVVPAATAALWSATFRQQLAVSAALAAGCGAAGLVAAYHLDLAAGATIVVLAVAVFLVSLVVRRGSA